MSPTTARSPREVVCDSSTAGRLARAGVLATSPTGWLVVVVLSVVSGIAYTQLSSRVAGVVAGGLVLALTPWVRFVQLRKLVRRAAHRGAVMGSHYDEEGRLVITTASGATGLDRGSVSAWSRSNGVVSLRLRLRPTRLLVLAELVDDADLAFLTDPSGASQSPTTLGTGTPGDGPTPPPALPFHLTMTEQDQRLVGRAAVRLWLTRPQTWLVIGLDGLGLVAALLMHSGWLVAVMVLCAVLCGRAPWSMRRALRQIYPVGSDLRAGLTGDALLVQTPLSLEKVLRSTVVSVVDRRDGTIVELPGRRRVILPARLLPADAVAALAAGEHRT